MGFVVLLNQDFRLDQVTSALTLIILTFVIGNAVYNLYFHPLAGIPGPFLWRATRLRFIQSLVAGNVVRDVRQLHKQYGEIVRTAPNEVSFASGGAWSDILSFPRNPTFFKAPPGQPDNLITTIDTEANSRMRQVVMPAYTERSLLRQESILQSYTTLMMDRLKKKASSADELQTETVIDVVDWFNWFTFDVIGELTFGESFSCLKDTANHPWVSMIFSSLKVMALAAATRYFAGLEALLLRFLPAKLRKMQQDHYAIALDKIHRRMDRKDAREDLMTPMLENNSNFERMSLEEVESTVSLLLIAGSETTGTTLCGTLLHLVQNPAEMAKLNRELRSNFVDESELTLRALQKLPFLNALLNEGLRLCNPVAVGILRVAPPGGSSVCGKYMPEGTHVTVNTNAMARSEANFHRSEEFLPDRFLPDGLRPDEFSMDRRNILKPFGLGGRSCLGKAIALAEMRLVLARLVWNFEFGVAPGKSIKWTDLKTYAVVQKVPIEVTIKARL